jgi:DNA helicase IV
LSNTAGTNERAPDGGTPSDELTREQEYVSALYAKVDRLRRDTSARLAEVLRNTGGTHQARVERDVATAMHTDQLAQFSAAESGLCFGRLDFENAERSYIGRIGLFDEENGYEPLLMDWRAPAARPFYLATAASPDGVRRRRHIRTKLRRVVGVDDEILDLASAERSGRHADLTGEATLLAALNASRTGQMSDIVATIQAEQDHVIRDGLNGVLVVQGGPGTGKTAVALHRAAYLLYTHRRKLSSSGVLVVGPNATFLRYISQVLPSLGETSVVLSTVGDLYPGLSATGREPVETAELKGRLGMADVVAAAVRDRQRVPDAKRPLEIPFERETLYLDRRIATQARTRARRSRQPHNLARRVFAREVIAALAEQFADRLGRSLLSGADLSDIRAEVRSDDHVRAALEQLWPTLTPQQLLTDLYADERRLAVAAKALAPDERALLRREPEAPWTPADVPLLDEAAELLGEDDTEERARAERQHQQALDYAQGVLDILEVDDNTDPDVLLATDVVGAHQLAERHFERGYQTAAERAAEDRAWTYGHLIVDEAQELSAMAWRALMRRCPSRSMTVVGDIAQTGDRAGASSWSEVLGPYVGDRWRLAQLTVNYRTPAEIADVAADVLDAIDPALESPRSVREAGTSPWVAGLEANGSAGGLADLVAREAAAIGDGRLAVLAPAALVDDLAGVLGPAAAGDGEPVDLVDRQVVLLTVAQAKGLEFDSVIVVDPQGILDASPRGANDLYVALTRATQRLGVVHTGRLPAVLGRLERPADVAAC